MDIDKAQFTAKLNKPTTPYPFGTIRQKSLKRWGTLAKHFDNEEWNEAVDACLTMRGEFSAYLGLAKGRARLLTEKAAAFDHVFDVIGEAINRFLPSLDDPDKRKEIEDYLKAEGQSTDLLDKVAKKFSKDAEKPLIGSVGARQTNAFGKDVSYAIALGNYGYWGGFLATFNHYFKGYDTPLDSLDIDLCEEYLATYAGTLSHHFHEVYASYIVGDQSQLFSKSTHILHLLEAEMDQLARIAAMLSTSLERRLKGGKVSPRKLGIVALEAGKVARKWALLGTLSMYTARIALLPEDHEEVEERISDARELPFESKIEDGRNITHKSLLDDSAGNKGKYLEIQGVVSDTKATRTNDGKLLSEFTLISPAGTETIPVIAVYENLKHVGIIDGCYVNINGDWQTDSVLSNKPFLQLRQLSLAKLGRESWLDKMTHLLNGWFEHYPNGYFIQWSIGPEDKGQEDQKSARTGAGEIIFKEKFGLTRR